MGNFKILEFAKFLSFDSKLNEEKNPLFVLPYFKYGIWTHHCTFILKVMLERKSVSHDRFQNNPDLKISIKIEQFSVNYWRRKVFDLSTFWRKLRIYFGNKRVYANRPQLTRKTTFQSIWKIPTKSNLVLHFKSWFLNLDRHFLTKTTTMFISPRKSEN